MIVFKSLFSWLFSCNYYATSKFRCLLQVWPCLVALPVCVLHNTEGCFASENMNNARSESWPLVQRSYIKFTCYQSRWHNIRFVLNVFFLLFFFIHNAAGSRHVILLFIYIKRKRKERGFGSTWLSHSHSSAWYHVLSSTSLIGMKITKKVAPRTAKLATDS